MTEKLSNQECISILKETETPLNIFLHSRKVNAVSMFLAVKLKDAGEEVNLDLVNGASLLHDVKKFHSLGDKETHHEKAGEEYLKSLGYDEIANVVGKHGGKRLMSGGKFTWEEKIVNYADARVMHDKIVSLNERFEDLNKRYIEIYPDVIERNKVIIKLKKQIEYEIFSKLEINPEDLNEELIKEYLIEDDY